PHPDLQIKEDGSAVDNIADLVTVLANNTLYFHPFQVPRFRADVHKRSYRCLASNAL
ncbi:unnamed protein product, partial [Lymnaea stagnalis]